MRNKIIHSKGFTLIEIMITIAVLGILSSAAINAFESQKRKGYRTDGIRAVNVMAQRMENWRASTGAYTTDINDVGGNVFPTPPDAPRYGLVLVADAAAETYTITATAVGPQAKDEDCYRFILAHTGRKTAEKLDTTANDKCWPK